MRYKIEIEYDGTFFAGWQRQKEVKSVQEVIENALVKIAGEKIEVHACGRTDAGVHSLAMVAHFDLNKNILDWQIRMALNHYLQGEMVGIISCIKVDDNFHSRFDAKMRHYQYKILNRRTPPILDKNRAWHIAHELDLDEMRKAAQYLIGQHDFTSFRDAECQAKSAIKTLDKIEIEKNGEMIILTVSAKSFLHHMVRNIVGTLVLVGGKKISADDVKKILEAKDRSKSGPNAPAWGLYFYKVEYTK